LHGVSLPLVMLMMMMMSLLAIQLCPAHDFDPIRFSKLIFNIKYK
jgi:hypothetical protein